MTHVPIPVNALNSRAVLENKLREHDTALNTLESGELTPETKFDTTAGGELDNYALPSNCAVLVFAPASGNIDLTGMTPGAANQILDIYNQGPHNLSLYDNNNNSLAANRFLIAGAVAAGNGNTMLLTPGAFARLRFDGTNWWVHAFSNSQTPSSVIVNGEFQVTAQATIGSYVQIGGGSGPKIWSGTGSPNSVLAGSPGDMYLRTDGGAGTTLYIKESGANTNTGWVAK